MLSMEYNGPTKTFSRLSRSWILVTVFLVFTFLTLMGYTLMSKFSWTHTSDDKLDKETGKCRGERGPVRGYVDPLVIQYFC